MRLGSDPLCRFARALFCLTLLVAWHVPTDGQFVPPTIPGSSKPKPADPTESPSPPQDQEKLKAARDQLGRVFKAIETVDAELPRDSFDPSAIVTQVGGDRVKLFEWVRDQTVYASYRGQLRGATGVLMDRTGNSLDRSLLLATLLQKAGQSVRLAHGTIAPEQAKTLQATLRTEPATPQPPQPSEAIGDELRKLAEKHGINLSAVTAEQTKLQFGADKRTEKLAERLSEQTPALLQAVGGEPAAAPAADVLATMSDHWWVQAADGDVWQDLDVLSPTAKPGEKLCEPAETIAANAQGQFPIAENLRHGVRIRLLIETCQAGKATEQSVFDQIIRADEVFGQRITISHWPLNWPGDDIANSPDLRKRTMAITAEQKEWMPVVRIGSKQILQTSFTATGEIDRKPNPDPMARFGKALGKIGNVFDALDAPAAAPAGKPELTAEWIEYQVISPGEPARVHRRQVFDLVGPAVRTSNIPADLKLTEPQLVERGLALLGGFEVLPLPCRLSPAFVTHLSLKATIANQSQMLWLLDNKAAADRKAAMKKLESMTPPPGPLNDLAITRHTTGRFGDKLTYTHTNVLTCRWQPRVDFDAGKVTLCQGFDIVENGLSARPDPKTSAFTMRLEQGVLETNAEALLTGGCSLVENTANAFDLQQEGWITVRKVNDPAWQAAKVPADVRTRVNEAVAGGMVAVVSGKPVDINGRQSFGWWRVDPATGQTLGMSDIGGGATMAEYAFMVVSVALCGALAFLDGKLSVQDAAVCILSSVGGGLAGGLFAGKAVGLGIKIGLIMLSLATGIWLNQSPILQNGIGG